MELKRAGVAAATAAMALALAVSPASAGATKQATSPQTGSQQASSQQAASGNVLRRWGATMGGSQAVTAAQAVADAQNVDVLVGHTNTFAPYTAQMRAAHSSLKLVSYLNGALSSTNATYPESWYSHDGSGHRINATAFNMYLMDPTAPSWIQSRIDECNAALVASGWDGCYLDSLGGGILTPGYLTGQPINPSTGAQWTIPDWVKATSSLAATVQSGLPGKWIVLNGLGAGVQYFRKSWGPSSILLGGVAGGNAEGFVRGAAQPVTQFEPPAQLKMDVDMLVDVGNRGRSMLAMTKVWVSSATQAQKNALHRYALATFLLGTNGSQYWYWSDTGAETAVVEDTPYEHVAVGSPTGSYTTGLGAFVRHFSSGVAVVNPTTKAVTIDLGGTYTNLEGSAGRVVTLGPRTGDVYHR